MKLSQNVKKQIIIRKINIRELSKITGISTANISDILNEKVVNPRIDTLVKFAEAFDMTIDELIGRKKN